MSCVPFPTRLEAKEQSLVDLYQQMENVKVELQKPFAQEQEYHEKSARLNQLNIMLSMDQGQSTMKVIEPEELPAELFNLICEYDPDIMELSWGGRDQQISYIHDKLEKGDTAGFTSFAGTNQRGRDARPAEKGGSAARNNLRTARPKTRG